MIDDRFPPKPLKTRVKLYSNNEKILHKELNQSNQKRIDDYFLNFLGFDKVFFFNSCTQALIAWLRFKFDFTLNIAIPSFFCPEMAKVLLNENHQLILYDINEYDFFITNKSLNYVLNNNVDVFIFPFYFGFRKIDENKLNLIKQKVPWVVMDLAQSFPLKKLSPYHDNKTIFIFSFGKSKPLACQGGGAIIPPRKCQILSKTYKKNYESNIIANEKIINKSFETHLFKLLNKRYINAPFVTIEPSTIDVNLYNNINYNYQKFLTLISTLTKRYKVIKDIFIYYKKKHYLRFCDNVEHFPSILALKITKLKRYDFSSLLASHNIESTWYYYPVHLLFKKEKITNTFCPNTLSIAQNILIIPFNLHQSEHEFSVLKYSLERILCNL